jgi:hypothetical protein
MVSALQVFLDSSGMKSDKKVNQVGYPGSVRIASNLFHRDFFINFIDINSLRLTVKLESNINDQGE